MELTEEQHAHCAARGLIREAECCKDCISHIDEPEPWPYGYCGIFKKPVTQEEATPDNWPDGCELREPADPDAKAAQDELIADEVAESRERVRAEAWDGDGES